MLKIHSFLLWGLLGVSNAQAQIAPPTSLPPSNLPPLPKNVLLPTEAVTLPPVQEQTPAQLDVAATPAVYNSGELTKMLQKEVQRFAQAVAPAFTVVLLPTDDPMYKQFVAGGLLKMTAAEYAQHDYGLSGMMIQGGKVNTTTSDVCYVLFDASRGEQLWKTFVVPLNTNNHSQTAAAWLVGHEVGHCLDQRERSQKINTRLSWRAEDAQALGLWPNAVRKAYGTSFAKDAFLAQPWNLLQEPSQQQYGERVADIFATFWTLKLGANPQLVNVVRDIRSKVSPAAAHYTAPVFDAVQQNASFATRQVRVDVIWDLSRNLQKQLGVTAQADSAAPRIAGANSGTTQPSGPPEIARWIVTSRGPVPVDAYGKVIPQQSSTPQPQNFKNLPRFGR